MKKPSILREFDLTYWQMRCALGYPIPSRIEARWPHGMNMGNPFKCGLCDARRKFPDLHLEHDAERRGGFYVGPSQSAGGAA